jgi:hypothetical protein
MKKPVHDDILRMDATAQEPDQVAALQLGKNLISELNSFNPAPLLRCQAPQIRSPWNTNNLLFIFYILPQSIQSRDIEESQSQALNRVGVCAITMYTAPKPTLTSLLTPEEFLMALIWSKLQSEKLPFSLLEFSKSFCVIIVLNHMQNKNIINSTLI